MMYDYGGYIYKGREGATKVVKSPRNQGERWRFRELLRKKTSITHPTLWGDFFLHHIPCPPIQCALMKDKAKLKNEEVKTTLLDTDSFDLYDKLEFIDTLEQLGLDHHYTKEIHEQLRNVSEAGDRDLDLPTTSLQFYVLRKHGYRISSDVFLKFRDDRGNVVSNDARCLLRLYDSQLRVHGEEILDNIVTLTKS
ncbi:hypothetical protein SEVIR_6G066900v4 [Setaria viridis]|uniref:Terpene synthase N-terminal domain-containing protein n=1 Tax=Setaria viridis TaxID=4556 RepID=A0A4U6U2L3_SETVI|nr:hypothetical protein SEVIR_6G066900v2 [Setaria viridis]